MSRSDGTLGDAEMPAPAETRPGPRGRVVAARPVKADPDSLLDDAREAMAHELRRIKTAAKAQALAPADARTLALLTDAAIKLAREEREAAKADDLSGLPKDELLSKGREALEELDR